MLAIARHAVKQIVVQVSYPLRMDSARSRADVRSWLVVVVLDFGRLNLWRWLEFVLDWLRYSPSLDKVLARRDHLDEVTAFLAVAVVRT